MNSIEEPKLAPPGAGLPGIELVVARMLFRWSVWTGNRESFNAGFRLERERIRALLAGVDAESASRRVLIERLPGLEDSSRFWSAWMTLDHLRIVNGSIAKTVRALTNGIIPKGAASTAAVKPNPAVTGAVVEEYEKSCDDVFSAASAVDNLKTAARFAHPWFGPLDARGWHALAGSHMKIHRGQLERIIEGLIA